MKGRMKIFSLTAVDLEDEIYLNIAVPYHFFDPVFVVFEGIASMMVRKESMLF
jgi:hypothetical protein